MPPLDDICRVLLSDSNALAVLLFTPDGDILAFAGDEPLDADAIDLSCEGEQFSRRATDSILTVRVASLAILAVRFDANSSLGLIRLRVRKATERIREILPPTGASGPLLH